MEPEKNVPQGQTSSPSRIAPAQNLAIPFAIIVAGVAIAAAIYFGGNKKDTLTVPTVPQGNKIVDIVDLDPVGSNDHILGNPNAKIMIVEYSDLECPFCKTFHATMTQVMNEYGESGKVAWVYRHFPLAFHPKADKEAQATECVAKLGNNKKFWEYTNKIFSITPSNNNLDLSLLPKLAKEIGIEETAFNACLESGETKPIVDAHLSSGVKAKVNGTPHSLIVVNKKVVGTINGAQPFEVVKPMLDALLK